MKKTLIYYIFCMLIISSVAGIDFNPLPSIGKSVNLTAIDGMKFELTPLHREMSIYDDKGEKQFLIRSTSEIRQIGNIGTTKEWGYLLSGTETISGDLFYQEVRNDRDEITAFQICNNKPVNNNRYRNGRATITLPSYNCVEYPLNGVITHYWNKGDYIINYAAGYDPTVVTANSNTAHDAEEKGGSVSLTSSDLEILYDSGDQTVGFYFPNVAIPAGSTIISSNMEFKCWAAGADSDPVYIQIEDHANPPIFSTGANNITARDITGTTVQWSNVASDMACGDGNRGNITNDISSLIQDAVNNPSWSSGNSIVLIVNSSASSVSYGRMYSATGADSWQKLYINYTTGGGGDTTQPPVPDLQYPIPGGEYFNNLIFNIWGSCTDTENATLHGKYYINGTLYHNNNTLINNSIWNVTNTNLTEYDTYTVTFECCDQNATVSCVNDSNTFKLTDTVAPDLNTVWQLNSTNGETGNWCYINWTTDEAANNTLWWGVADQNASGNHSNAAYVTYDEHNITGLLWNITYWHYLELWDKHGNKANSTLYWCTTPEQNVTPPVVPGLNSCLENHTSNSFSVVVIPDTQRYTTTTVLNQYFYNMTLWIANHTADYNITYVIHVGDVIDSANTTQYDRANLSLSVLDTYTVPYSVIRGNHDTSSMLFQTYFPYGRWSWNPLLINYHTNSENTVHQFNASGLQFLIISLSWTVDAGDLAFLNETLNNYSSYRTIIDTHQLHNYSCNPVLDGDGLNVYNSAKYYNQTFLMLGGHVHCDIWTNHTYAGNTIQALTSSYQDEINGGNGRMHILNFYPDENRVHYQTYSASTDQCYYGVNASLNFSYDMSPPACTPDLINVSLGYIYGSWSAWYNNGTCNLSNEIPQSRTRWRANVTEQYDNNSCVGNVTYYTNNVTISEHNGSLACNYCSYTVLYDPWGPYDNVTCGTRNRTYYSDNWGSCCNATWPYLLGDAGDDCLLLDNNTYNGTYVLNETLSCTGGVAGGLTGSIIIYIIIVLVCSLLSYIYIFFNDERLTTPGNMAGLIITTVIVLVAVTILAAII